MKNLYILFLAFLRSLFSGERMVESALTMFDKIIAKLDRALTRLYQEQQDSHDRERRAYETFSKTASRECDLQARVLGNITRATNARSRIAAITGAEDSSVTILN